MMASLSPTVFISNPPRSRGKTINKFHREEWLVVQPNLIGIRHNTALIQGIMAIYRGPH